MFLYLVMLVLSLFVPVNYFIFESNLALMVIALTGLILVFSQSVRQLNIINLSKRIRTFKRDIYFFFLSLLILIFFIMYLTDYFILYILVSSIFSVIVYLMYYNPLTNYKINNAN